MKTQNMTYLVNFVLTIRNDFNREDKKKGSRKLKIHTKMTKW